MSRIYQYPVVTEIGSDDYLALGSTTNGSRAILASDLAPVIGNKTITERGTYKASDDNMDGYGQVTVDIPYTDIHVASGDIATFEGEDLPLKSLKVAVTPYQDLSHGDPSPSNICPISGWDEANVTRCGKNLFNKSDTQTGVLKADGSVGAGVTKYVSGYIKISPNTSYYLTDVIPANDGRSGFWYDANKNPIEVVLKNPPSLTSFAVTSPSNAEYIRIGCYISSAETCQLELGDTATTYSPYNGQTYTIDLDGTRYGGEVDVVNGSGTMDKDSVSLNSIDAFSSDAVNDNGYIRYNCGIVGKAQNFNILCDKIKVIQSTVQANANEELISGNANNNKLYFTIDSTRLSGDLSTSTGRSNALKTYLATNDIQVVYELATPITVQLSPTQVKSLEGTNNIFANCGAVDVEYQTVWVRPTN